MGISINLSGQVALVTGGGKGVGRGISERFLAAGAEVVVCGRTAPDTMPESDGRPARFIECDIRDKDAVAAMFESISELHSSLDVVINNAGGSPSAEAASASPRFSAAIIELNLLAAMHCAQLANKKMQQQASGGAIINVGSVSGLRPSPGTAAYGAAKAGLLNLTESLAIEWAPKVRVNAVTPGLIHTEQAALHYGDDAAIERIAKTVPLGRLGSPRDVGDACLFLASPLSGYVSGANLVVHGGGERPQFLSAREENDSEPS